MQLRNFFKRVEKWESLFKSKETEVKAKYMSKIFKTEIKTF